MSHPKNSNKPAVAQEPLLTDASLFYRTLVDHRESSLLLVRPAKEAKDALNLSSMLQTAAVEILGRLTEEGMSAAEIFGVRFLLEASVALVEASSHSVEFGNRQGGAA